MITVKTEQVNREAKSLFAKLLASEDIMVRHDTSEKTATFDTETRILTLPVLNGMDNDVYDLFVGHEVGHALFTPQFTSEAMLQSLTELCPENIMLAKHVLNAVEDARIERLMRIKYPGLGKNFIRGYRKLLDTGFFKETISNYDSLIIIDRINLWYKLGIYGIEEFDMNDTEQSFIHMIDAAKTFDEVYAISKKIIDLLKSDPQNQKMFENANNNEQIEMPTVESSDGNGNLQFSSEPSSDDSNDESEENSNQKSNQEQQEGTENQDSRNLTKPSNSGANPFSGSDALSEYIKKESEKIKNDVYLYNAIPSPNLNRIIIPWNDVHDQIEYTYNEHLNAMEDGVIRSRNPNNSYQYSPYTLEEIFSKFDKETRHAISGMAAAFKRKQQAFVSRRISIGKTGRLDMNSIHRFNYDDDLFLRSKFIPKGKNHGMIMYVDWSGSMSGNIRQTMEQAINLAYFCRSVNIPFRVYAFTNVMFLLNSDPEKYNTNRSGSFWIYNGKKDKFGNPYCRMDNFHLLEFLSSEMNSNQFNKCVKNILYILDLNAGAFNYYPPGNYFSLGGTPLNETIVASIDITKQFQQKNNIQIMNNIFLTDGEAGGYLFVDPNDLNWSMRKRKVLMYKGRQYEIGSFVNQNIGCSTTNTLLQIQKEETSAKAIGFFLTNSYGCNRIMSSTRMQYSELAKKNSEFKKNNYISIKHDAYDVYYIMQSNASVSTLDDVFDSIDSSLDTKKIISSFVKSSNNRGKSRILLNNFAEIVAQDLK